MKLVTTGHKAKDVVLKESLFEMQKIFNKVNGKSTELKQFLITVFGNAATNNYNSRFQQQDNTVDEEGNPT